MRKKLDKNNLDLIFFVFSEQCIMSSTNLNLNLLETSIIEHAGMGCAPDLNLYLTYSLPNPNVGRGLSMWSTVGIRGPKPVPNKMGH